MRLRNFYSFHFQGNFAVSLKFCYNEVSFSGYLIPLHARFPNTRVLRCPRDTFYGPAEKEMKKRAQFSTILEYSEDKQLT